MNWLLRNWFGLLMLGLTLGLVVCSILVEVEMPFSTLPVLFMAGICLAVGLVSRFLPLDVGTYAPMLREHALVAYRLWRNMQRSPQGLVKHENEEAAFNMIDWLFANVAMTSRLYRDMSEEEGEFWCAYVEYRLYKDDAAPTHDSVLQGLCAYLRDNRTTPEQRERAELRMVLTPTGVDVPRK